MTASKKNVEPKAPDQNMLLLNSCMQNLQNNTECIKTLISIVETALPHTVPELQRLMKNWLGAKRQIEQNMVQMQQQQQGEKT